MDAVEYQRIRNQMCQEYGQSRIGCEGACPLAWLCTPEDGQGREEEVVKAVEDYHTQKAAERGEYAEWVAAHCEAECGECPIGVYAQCKVLRDKIERERRNEV